MVCYIYTMYIAAMRWLTAQRSGAGRGASVVARLRVRTAVIVGAGVVALYAVLAVAGAFFNTKVKKQKRLQKNQKNYTKLSSH